MNYLAGSDCSFRYAFGSARNIVAGRGNKLFFLSSSFEARVDVPGRVDGLSRLGCHVLPIYLFTGD
jgi:hypothetical protein